MINQFLTSSAMAPISSDTVSLESGTKFKCLAASSLHVNSLTNGRHSCLPVVCDLLAFGRLALATAQK